MMMATIVSKVTDLGNFDSTLITDIRLGLTKLIDYRKTQYPPTTRRTTFTPPTHTAGKYDTEEDFSDRVVGGKS